MAVLADGMGRHYGGRIASRIAVETFLEVFEEGMPFIIRNILSEGHSRVQIGGS